jgi:hypothetical protein
MFGKRFNSNALPAPAVAETDPKAVEVLRVWASSGRGQEFVLKPTWKDAASWGLLLVDVARQAANAYASEGHDRAKVLARIKAGFDAEWSSPTDAS